MVKTGILVKYKRDYQACKKQVGSKEVQKALEGARHELQKEIDVTLNIEHKDILSTQLEMLNDPFLLDNLKEVGLEACEQTLIKAVPKRIKTDIEDVFTRIKKHLNQEDKTQKKIKEPFILYAETMYVSELSSFDLTLLQGVLLKSDMSETSHLALILKSYGIPFIFNYKEKVEEGAWVRIDFKIRKEKIQVNKALLKANLNSCHDFVTLNALKAVDAGLVRSELLFLGQSKVPTPEEQQRIYKKCFSSLTNNQAVNFRVFDFSQDKRFEDVLVNHENSLDILIEDNLDLLKTQLKTVLSIYPVHLILPHVENVNQIKKIRSLLNELGYESTPIVAMIESVKAVNKIEEIASFVEEIAIGTNDLYSDFFQVPRESKKIEKNKLPEFYKLLEKVIRKTKECGLKVCVCGDLASNQETATCLDTMGVDILSVNVGCLID